MPVTTSADHRCVEKGIPDKTERRTRGCSDASEREVRVSIANSVQLGRNVVVLHPEWVNLYGCRIGDDTRIGPFVEIQRNASVGARCKISSHSFICEGVALEDEVFVGHGVMFTNDRWPRSTTADGRLQDDADWTIEPTRVKRGASIGSNATIVCGITVGAHALVGAGAVVTRDVPDHAVVAGVPARVIGDTRELNDTFRSPPAAAHRRPVPESFGAEGTA
jgi:acetyltransferase-like isoleucine patch superfamily enzyme